MDTCLQVVHFSLSVTVFVSKADVGIQYNRHVGCRHVGCMHVGIEACKHAGI